ncbi:MAG: hypothetical protein QOE82_3641, partial [Thermoanaerobaculia bacterium]|nr:hypothetical protein [Thermoanaerobaculia bacterium]
MSKLLRIVVLTAFAVGAPLAVQAQVDLRVSSVTGSPSNITLATGDVTYSVSIFNGSGTSGTSPVLTMTLPGSSTYVSASVTGGGSCGQAAGTVTCNWASIPASNTFTATVVVTPTAGGTLTLNASVSGVESDPTPANNTNSGSVNVNSQIDLRVSSVTGSPSNITLNTGNVTFSASIFNAA